MNIVPAPKTQPQKKLLALMLEKSQQGVTLCIVDDKGRYSHWDKIRHLTPPKPFDNIEQYWAFIKGSRISQYKPLPFIESFVYILTDDIQQSIHEIDSKMHGSIEADNLNHNKDRYIVRSLIEEAISSSQLEGAVTTREVAREMLKSKRAPRDDSEQMIYNNYQAVQFINKHKDDDLTPKLTLELHQIVTKNAIDNPDDAGRLRLNNNIAVWDDAQEKSLHTPPDYTTLPDRLKILCDFANGDSPKYFIHPIIRAIIVHFMLGFDHPFADGNGRTARALFYWVVLKNNYWLFQYITLSTYIKKSPAKYAESFLMTETDDFDTTYFINQQFDFIKQAITGLFDYIDKKQTQQQQALDLLKFFLADGLLNPRQALLIQHAIKNPGIHYTIEGHKISNHISTKTARDDLLALAKLDLLQQSKRGRAFVFIAPNDLEQRIKAYK